MLYAKRINLLYIFKQTLLMCPYLVQTPNDIPLFIKHLIIFSHKHIYKTHLKEIPSLKNSIK